jgi:hypothetical protein
MAVSVEDAYAVKDGSYVGVYLDVSNAIFESPAGDDALVEFHNGGLVGLVVMQDLIVLSLTCAPRAVSLSQVVSADFVVAAAPRTWHLAIAFRLLEATPLAGSRDSFARIPSACCSRDHLIVKNGTCSVTGTEEKDDKKSCGRRLAWLNRQMAPLWFKAETASSG